MYEILAERYGDCYESIVLHWKSFDAGIAFLIFIAYAILDAFMAKYTIEVASLNEYRAATTGVITHFLLAFGVINYTQNYLYIFSLVAGSWLGTWWFVRRERLQKLKKQF